MNYELRDAKGNLIVGVKSEEGLFGFGGSKTITAYYSLREDDGSPTEKDFVWCYSDPKRCVRHMFDKYECGLNGVDEKQSTCDWEINLTEHDFTKIIIKAKNKDKLNTRVCLYKLEIIPDGRMDKYGVEAKSVIKVISKEVATVDEFTKKYGVKYMIDNTVQLSSSELRKFIQNTLTAVKDKIPNSVEGIGICKPDKEDIEEFLSGDTKSFPLIRYDAWDGTNNRARDEDAYNEFDEKLESIIKTVDETLKANPNTNKYYSHIGCDGDWDDGYYSVYIK